MQPQTTPHPKLQDPATPSSPPLPPGIDETLFTAEQLDYLSDLYTTTIVHHLRKFYTLLRAMPAGQRITCERVGINAAILCKLLGITECSGINTWHDAAAVLHVHGRKLTEQRHAVLATLRTLTRRR